LFVAVPQIVHNLTTPPSDHPQTFGNLGASNQRVAGDDLRPDQE
jgi:hypothetical protein